MGRLRQNFVEPTPPVPDPDIVPDPLPAYWPGRCTYRQLVEDESIFGRYPVEFWEQFRNGLEADKGVGALEAWRSDSSHARSQRKGVESLHENPKAEREAPEYVKALLADQGVWPRLEKPKEEAVDLPSWGYVVFRTAGYGEDHDEWQKAKKVWDELIDAQFANDISRSAVGAKQARDKFECLWIEGPEWEGASRERMAEHYHAIAEQLPAEAYRQYLFLCIDARGMASLISAPPEHQRHFSYMPMSYVQAVAAYTGLEQVQEEEEEAGDETPTGFNVAVQSLVNSLYPVVARQMLDFRELAVGVKEDEMWWAGGHVSRKIKS